MADMVASAVVQDVVSRALSFMLGNREEQATPQAHRHDGTERLEMAVSELQFVLERTAKLPITDLSLLCRRKVFKLAHVEATDLLSRHRQQGHGSEVVKKQAAKRSKLWITRECASQFLRDVESGFSLRQYNFCNPVVRHLLDGKTIRYEMETVSKLRRFYLWPICLEGRGVEMMLEYWYEDYKVPEKYFHLALMLRVSESTDIIGTAVKCLQSMASQFKVATETAAGELTQIPNLQQISDSHAAPLWADADEESHAKYSQSLRPDPVCCKDCANYAVSSELSLTIPDQVILFSFGCYIISAVECSSSSGEVGAIVMREQSLPLELIAVFAPHFVYKEGQPQEGYALEKSGDHVKRRYVSVQEVAETIRSKAISCFLHQPEQTGYAVSWIAEHGFAGFDVQKQSTERGTKTSGRSTNRRNSKRRR